MRLVVISDTHGRPSLIDRVLRREKEANEVFFLGDEVSDIESVMPYYPDKNFHIVFDIVEYPGAVVYFTHGHKHSVKRGTDGILSAAKGVGAGIALYGHTHISSVEYKDGIYLINSGSLSLPRDGKASYAVIDIADNGILPTIECV